MCDRCFKFESLLGLLVTQVGCCIAKISQEIATYLVLPTFLPTQNLNDGYTKSLFS